MFTMKSKYLKNIFEKNLFDRLPVSFISQAKLGSLAAQAEFGDYEASFEYTSYLKNSKIAQTISELLLEKVEELHKQNKLVFII